jgi:DNA-binding CsgD family transcriptional regulator
MPMTAHQAPVLLGRAEERAALVRLLDDARGGASAALVIRGEAGVGKTALLRHCARQAAGLRVAQVAGVESEMELPFAGLHQLCSRMLDRIDEVPEAQREALGVALGMSAGPPPDRFLIGLATLSLLSSVAEERPLLCLLDDAQWLDEASGQVLGFVARRLHAESVAMLFAVREPLEARELARLPELRLDGLAEDDARALLATVVPGRIDEAVRDRLVAETRGNPLAILQLPGALDAIPLAFDAPAARRIEERFLRRLEALHDETQRLLLIAAAEPADDPLPIWRAAERLDVSPAAAAGAKGLLTIGERVTFLHPLLRSAVYRSASLERRRAVHAALAEAVDEADRRAWHLAAAAPGPDEDVAAALEAAASRADARGGPAAAAAFLERAGTLSPGPRRRAARLLAAATAKHDAGALDAALDLLDAVDADALDALGRGRAEVLRGQIAFDQMRPGDAARHLAAAAQRLEPVDAALARQTHLLALGAAMWDGDGVREIASAALRAPTAPQPPAIGDALLAATARLVIDGHAAAAPALRRALELVLASEAPAEWLWFATAGNAITIAQELWEPGAWATLAAGFERSARDVGALAQLSLALGMQAWVNALAGDAKRATTAIEEERAITDATGNPSVAFLDMIRAAWCGDEPLASELIAATRAHTPVRSRIGCFAAYSAAVLHNSEARHADAFEAASTAFAPNHLGYGSFVVPELAEAAARTGDAERLTSLIEWMGERTVVTRTDWSLGTEALVRGLAGEGDDAFRDAVERFGRTWLRPQHARAQLLYGEWLRREGRRSAAREQLRAAHEALAAMGLQAFARRAARELAATGERVRRRSDETRDDLTPQERQIALLAREGLSNPDIGARLFLSPRTVEWHMKKVFRKLDIVARGELREALDDQPIQG